MIKGNAPPFFLLYVLTERGPKRSRVLRDWAQNDQGRRWRWQHVTSALLFFVLIGCGAAPEHELFPIYPQYAGESITEGGSVRYLSADERETLRARTRDGLFIDAAGAPLDPQLDQNPERGGFATYVIDPNEQLYLSFDHRHHHFHHSSILAGGPVLAAGDMTIIEGQLTKVSNASGHYRPPPRSLKVVRRVLERLGISTEEVEFERIGSDLQQGPTSTAPRPAENSSAPAERATPPASDPASAERPEESSAP